MIKKQLIRTTSAKVRKGFQASHFARNSSGTSASHISKVTHRNTRPLQKQLFSAQFLTRFLHKLGAYAFKAQRKSIFAAAARRFNFNCCPPFFFVVCFTWKHLKISSVAVLSAARKYLLFLKIAPRKGFSFPFCC